MNTTIQVGQVYRRAIDNGTRFTVTGLGNAKYGVHVHASDTDSVHASAVGDFEAKVAAGDLVLVEYVTATDEQDGIVWHLTDADGQPVAAGEHADAAGDRFTIDAAPEFIGGAGHGEPPTSVLVSWDAVTVHGVTYPGTRSHWRAADLVSGWVWTPEWPNHGVKSA